MLAFRLLITDNLLFIICCNMTIFSTRYIPVFKVIATVLILVTTVSCKQKHTPWDAGSDESNRLMLTFDSLCTHSSKFRDSVPLLKIADRLAMMGKTDSLSMARYYYVKGRIAKWHQNDSLQLYYTDKGLTLIDSAAYPYEYARFIYDISHLGKTLSDKYQRVAQSLPIFQEYNDSINVAQCYMSLGAAHSMLNDFEEGLRYSRESRRMYQLIRDSNAVHRINRNIVHCLMEMKRKDEAFRLSDSMRQSPLFGRDIAVDCLVVTNLYDSTKNISLLYQGLDIAKPLLERIEEPLTPVPYIAAKAGRYYLSKNMLDSARYFYPTVKNAVDDGRSVYYDMLLFLAEIAEAEGDARTGREYRYTLNTFDSAAKQQSQVMKAQNKIELDRMHAMTANLKTHKESVSLTATVVLIICVIIAALIAWGIVGMVRRRSARKIERLSDDLSTSNSQLAKAHLKNAEKNEVLNRTLSEVKEISKNPTDAKAKSSKIATDIKIAANSESDWEKFEITYEQAHPDFIRRLREQCPTLSKGDLRLACMIAMGMDNKHIAHVLSINADSVKKNRQRLRAKLKLDADTTLPDYLAFLGKDNHY